MQEQLERLRQTLKQGFGAPGDWGYESREGKALFEAYKLIAEMASIEKPATTSEMGRHG